MSRHPLGELAELASLQHGVFSGAQARSVGISVDTLRQRVRTGEYLRTESGVYVVRGSAPSWHRDVSQAVISVDGAVASHTTAACLWGLLDREPKGHEVTTVRWRRKHRSFIVHESLDLSPKDKTHVEGIAVTTPERTVVDLGASARWAVEAALEKGIRKELLTLATVQRFVDRVARRGRRGVGVIRPLLEFRAAWDGAADSQLEAEFMRVVSEYGLEMPVGQLVVRNASGQFICRADFAYPSSRLLIELDSEAHHMDRLTFRRDRAKQNQTELQGWRTLRYTWWDLVDHPGGVAREVSTALAS